MTKPTANPFPALTAAHATQIGVDTLAVIDGGKPGGWIILLPNGRFSGRDGRGPYSVNNATHMAVVVTETKKRAGITELVIDYDHQSMFSAVPGVGGLAPAAGWIKEYEVRDDGLYGRVEWTEKAAQAIRAGEYRYISPVYHHTKTGEVIRLISAGLTNTPNLDLAAVAARANPNQQEENMDKIALALGLAQGAGEDDILAAINTAMTSVAALAVLAGLDKAAKVVDIVPAVSAMRAGIDKVAVASGLKAGAKADDIVTAVQTAASGKGDVTQFVPIAQVTALQTEFNSLKASIDDGKAETAVNKAIEDGKLTPALKEWGLDLYRLDSAKFASFVGASPVLTATQRATAAAPNKGDPALSETDIAVMSQLGVSREAYLKTLKAMEGGYA
jgi:phage I-like protein